MKLLVDMNLSPSWLHLFADAGIVAAHWSMVGAHAATDAQIMAYARERLRRAHRTIWTSVRS